MKIIINIPDKDIPTKQDIIQVGLHFMGGKVVECDYPFMESPLDDIKAEIVDCVPWNIEERAMKEDVIDIIDKHIGEKE